MKQRSNFCLIVGVTFILLNAPLFLFHTSQEQKGKATETEKELAFEKVFNGFVDAKIQEKLGVSLISFSIYILFVVFVKTFIKC